jgi:hypothetical protein
VVSTQSTTRYYRLFFFFFFFFITRESGQPVRRGREYQLERMQRNLLKPYSLYLNVCQSGNARGWEKVNMGNACHARPGFGRHILDVDE